MIDLHAHILAGLDDGPRNLDEAAEMAAVAVAAGTRVMAATSHIDHGFALAPAELAAARQKLARRLADDGIALEVVQGGEIDLARAGSLGDAELRALTLGDGDWLLLECPLSPKAPPLAPMVDDLQRRGFRILLAHPERSPQLLREPEPLQRLVDMGALGQVTSGSFAGHFGEPPRRAAFAMLERGLVHVLASDAHDPSHRAPDMLEGLPALQRRYPDAEAQLEWMASAAPGALLAGEELPERPPAPRMRGVLGRILGR